ncbi:MAG: apolipoprotein N-acyltransferase [Alphaproteobacteria bacterium]|nr:apolipoprotein N-acyltransferase [Alphaproteobacteria bacterium]
MIARFVKWAEWVQARQGWQRTVLLFIAGALSALALAPYYLWPVLFVTFPHLLLQMEKGTARQTAWRCFVFGYGFFVAGTYWIAFSLLVDAAQFGWLFPISVFGLSAAFAIYFLVKGYLFAKLRTTHRFANICLFAALWVGFEYLRSAGIFGFPWNLLGYTSMASERLSQLASVTGTFGLSWLIALCLFPLIYRNRAYISAILALVIAVYSYGIWRVPSSAAPVTETRLRLVQPNIPQEMKWTDAGKDQSMRIHGVLTHMQTDAPLADVVIWSETAFPFTVYDGSGWFHMVRHFAPYGGAFITGVIRSHRDEVWNSMMVVDNKGESLDYYDKHQLVPFGEFVPLRSILPLEKITPGTIDFSRGEGVRTLRIVGVPAFSPLICYEVVFPWLAAKKDDRPAWLLNLTNDAWYGDTAGPYQHFDMTRMRAIEQGLPLARVANTGISALIDPYGRIVGKLPLNERGIIDKALPKQLNITPYAQFAEAPILLILFIFMLVYISYWRARLP